MAYRAKTQPTAHRVADHLGAIEDESRRKDCRALAVLEQLFGRSAAQTKKRHPAH